MAAGDLTEQLLDEAAQIISGVSGVATRPLGGSRYLRFTLSPTLVTYQIRWEAFRRITGFAMQPGIQFAITKNGMTVDGSGNLADSAGNAYVAPVDVSAGQVIWAGTAPSEGGTQVMMGLNIPVNQNEILYVSKNASQSVYMMLYFDYA